MRLWETTHNVGTSSGGGFILTASHQAKNTISDSHSLLPVLYTFSVKKFVSPLVIAPRRKLQLPGVLVSIANLQIGS
jgi:hypothetical protein